MVFIYCVEHKRRQTVRHDDVHTALFHTMKAYRTAAANQKGKKKLYDNYVSEKDRRNKSLEIISFATALKSNLHIKIYMHNTD